MANINTIHPFLLLTTSWFLAELGTCWEEHSADETKVKYSELITLLNWLCLFQLYNTLLWLELDVHIPHTNIQLQFTIKQFSTKIPRWDFESCQSFLIHLDTLASDVWTDKRPPPVDKWAPPETTAILLERVLYSYSHSSLFNYGFFRISLFTSNNLACTNETHVLNMPHYTSPCTVVSRSNSWIFCFCENQRGCFSPDWRLVL